MAMLLLVGRWQDTAPGPAPDPQVQALATLLFYILILLLVFLFGSYALLRASRRYAQSLTHKKPPPTDAGDVWAMHKVPGELPPDDPRPPAADDAGRN